MAGHKNKKPDDQSGTARAVGLGVMIPSLLVSCVVIGAGLGYYADLKLGTKPWLLLFGIIMGSIAGVREMMKILKKIQNGSK